MWRPFFLVVFSSFLFLCGNFALGEDPSNPRVFGDWDFSPFPQRSGDPDYSVYMGIWEGDEDTRVEFQKTPFGFNSSPVFYMRYEDQKMSFDGFTWMALDGSHYIVGLVDKLKWVLLKVRLGMIKPRSTESYIEGCNPGEPALAVMVEGEGSVFFEGKLLVGSCLK